MDSYHESMMDQLPTSGSGISDYPAAFPQFPDNGNLPSSYNNMSTGSYNNSALPSGNALGNFTPPNSAHASNFNNGPTSHQSSVSAQSFTMPYDAPSMQGGNPHPAMQLPLVSTPPSNKTIHSCTYCGLVLSSANALIEHKRIHTGDKPFQCHICSKRFTQKAHLNIHKRTHTGEKPYACPICHKRFAQSSHLSSHKRIHTGEKPYVCGMCNVGFTQKQRLDAHIRKHLDASGQNHLMPLQAQHDYRQGAGKGEENVALLQMVGHGMPYVKQEPDLEHGQQGLHGQPRDLNLSKSPGAESLAKMELDMKAHDAGRALGRSNKEGDRLRRYSDEEMDPKRKGEAQEDGSGISAPSFSSEGMFLHPSGYVAYGGVNDEEDASPSPSPKTEPESSSPNASSQQISPASGGHRRKPTVVRRRHGESPAKEDQQMSSKQSQGSLKDKNDSSSPQMMLPADDDDDEAKDNGDDNLGDEYHDTGAILDDKSDPPYHGSSQRHTSAGRMLDTNSSMHTIETRSQGRRNIPTSGMLSANGERNPKSTPLPPRLPGDPQSYMYGGQGQTSSGALSSAGLVKVNNRISLVNFTADELLGHLMKRDDIHKCQFCCLIFQDAAMYHIHCNMHDKADVRKCNMCGKLLQDKYDFIAHFLSMHQS